MPGLTLGQTLSDAGALTFSSGDIVTVDNPAQIAVSGSLSANGTTFNYNGGSANLNFTSTGLISGANNIFNLPVIVPYTDVPSLAGNTSFDQVEISAATLSTGTLALNLLGTNATNFSYQFPNGFTIGSGATLAVGPNVPGLTLGQTLSDAGALTFSSGDIVTVDNPAQIAVSGSLSANGTTFNYNGGSANLNFTSTGLISGANNIFNLPVIVPYTDVPSLAGNTSFDQVEISAATLSTGTLSLNLLGTNATNFSYQFPNGFTIDSGATLAVGPNVPGLTLGQTLSDAGAHLLVR